MQLLTVLSWKTYCRSRGVTSADVGRASWRKSSFSHLNGSCVEGLGLRFVVSSWVKGSFCLANGNCVELAGMPRGVVAVRDSKDTDGPVLRFTRDEWQAFLCRMRSGEFDGFGSMWQAGTSGRQPRSVHPYTAPYHRPLRLRDLRKRERATRANSSGRSSPVCRFCRQSLDAPTALSSSKAAFREDQDDRT